MDNSIRCLLPNLGTAIGYAVTVEVTTNDQDSPQVPFSNYYDVLNENCYQTVTQGKQHLIETNIVEDDSENPADKALLDNLALENPKFRQLDVKDSGLYR